jgi:excisionase family DNA binding protein
VIQTQKELGILERIEHLLTRLEPLLSASIDQQQKTPPSPITQNEEESLVSVPKAAKLLDVSKSSAEKWLREGKLIRIKLGRSARIRRAEINSVIRGEKVIEP